MEVDRTRRVAELIRRELSTLLNREVDDRRVKMVSITFVSISRDLKHAKVYVSKMEEDVAVETETDEIVAVLNDAAKYLRRLLSQRLDLRSTPSLRFLYDLSLRRAMDIGALIDDLNRPTANKNVAE